MSMLKINVNAENYVNDNDNDNDKYDENDKNLSWKQTNKQTNKHIVLD